LQLLRKAGLVKGEKRGYWTHYSVEKPVLQQLADDLIKKADKGKSSKTVCFRMYPEADRLCGKEVEKMCKDQCEHPEKLKGRPEECTQEQIKECHGDTKDHPCEKKKG